MNNPVEIKMKMFFFNGKNVNFRFNYFTKADDFSDVTKNK